MACFKQHGQHLAPHIGGLDGFARLDFTALGFGFVSDIGFLEFSAIEVVQIRYIRGREQGPLAFFHHAAHEQVWNPVGGVHVVGAATVITGVFTQLQELFHVQMPALKVCADSAFALAALVNGNSGVVDDFQKWHHALGFAIGALDVASQCAHTGPVIAQTACEFREKRVFFDELVNPV